MTDYEQARAAQIEKNQARLRELGLLKTVADINKSMAAERGQNRQQRAAKKAVGEGPAPRRIPSRRSERVQGKEPTNYNERVLAGLGLNEDIGERGGKGLRLLRENTQEEVYTLEHLKLLGSAAQPWELFVDGYDASGERIYDKVHGQTCHQCRQKTLGKRTACSCCQSLRGVFCGDCLFMRYGENVEEVNANPNWVCPVCRDLCNCSFHRIKKGWAPTGTLYRAAMREGYQSVAHYLVLTNLRKEDRPQAAHLFPEGALAALEEREAEAAAGASSSGEEEQGSEGPCSSGEVAEEACSSGAAVADQLLCLGGEQQEDEGASPSGAAGELRRGASRRGRAAAAKPSQPAAVKKAAAAGEAAAAEQQQQPAGERRSARGGRAASRQATIEQASRATKRKAAHVAPTPAAKKAAVASDKAAPASAGWGLRSMVKAGLAMLALA